MHKRRYDCRCVLTLLYYYLDGVLYLNYVKPSKISVTLMGSSC